MNIRTMLIGAGHFELNLPVKIHFGPEALSKVPNIVEKYCSNILLVTAQELVPAETKLRDCFAGSSVSLKTFYLPTPEPTCDFIDETAETLRPKKYEGIIGLGGGSVLDTAKALSIALTHAQPIWQYANLSNRPPLPIEHQLLPVFAIPTTSGTGAEVTPYAVLTNSETRQKGTIQQPEIFPKAAFIDATLAKTMPPALTAATGLDAFAHALESYLNVSKASPFSELFGKEAMQLIFQALPGAVQEPDKHEYRSTMAYASTFAGIAIAHRGTTTPHAIAEPLGALTHVPHAQAVSLCTVPVLKHTWRTAEAKLEALYDITPTASEKMSASGAELFVREVERLTKTVGMKKTAAECIAEDDVDKLPERLLDDVLAYKFRPLKQHPVRFSREELSTIIHEIIYG